jgi:hypothetical protein
MIPALPVPVHQPAPINQPTVIAANTLGTLQSKNHLNRVLNDLAATQAPVTSPDLNTPTPLPKQIAQELPSSPTPQPPTAPPAPNLHNTDSTRIPQTYVGPAISFANNSTLFGAVSRLPFARQLSIRPSAAFGNSRSILRVPVTYDFNLGDPEPFEANPLASFHAGGGVEFSSGGGTSAGDKFSLLGTIGVDFALFEGISILADLNTNFNDNTGATIGMGFEF